MSNILQHSSTHMVTASEVFHYCL